MGNIARSIPMGKVLFGRGDLAESAPNLKRVVDRFGAFDEHLFDARRIDDHLSAAGIQGPRIQVGDADVDLDRLRAVDAAMPGVTDRLWMGLGSHTPEDTQRMLARAQQAGDTGALSIAQTLQEAAQSGVRLDKRQAGNLNALRAAGYTATPEQYQHLLRQRSSLKGLGQMLGDQVIGEAPLEVTRQRYIQGGLLGKGGLLTGELAPPTSLRRTGGRLVDAVRRGDMAAARKEIVPTVARTSLVWAPGVYFSYGVPVQSAMDTWEGSKELGLDAKRTTAANIAGSALGVLASPLGFAQQLVHGPVVDSVHQAMNAPTLGQIYQMRQQARAGGTSLQQAATQGRAPIAPAPPPSYTAPGPPRTPAYTP